MYEKVRYVGLRYIRAQYGGIRYVVLLYCTQKYGTMSYSKLGLCMVRYGILGYGEYRRRVQYGGLMWSMCNTVSNTTMRYATERFDTARQGIVGYCSVR